METPPNTTVSNITIPEQKVENQNQSHTLSPPTDKQQVSHVVESPSPTNQNTELATEPTSNEIDEEDINILLTSSPSNIVEYSNHLNKLATLLNGEKFDAPKFLSSLHSKFIELIDNNPLNNSLYIIIDANFDIFIKLATNYKFLEISTAAIRFLTTVFMNLNYWEVYNLLIKKPILYHFLNLINFDLNDCYINFINDYSKFTYTKIQQAAIRSRSKSKITKRRKGKSGSTGPSGTGSTMLIAEENMTPEERAQRSQAFFSLNPDTSDHDKYVADVISGANKQKRKFRPDVKLEHHKIIKKPQPVADKSSSKSSNYDPDVVHECQLPSAEEPQKLCLRRFSRKYELIRHQETVHSKKKKLFKCYVCVKQNPGVGPRIFTRHDTLAKHIRVNHKISGKEAKAEVAYSKKHAEVVEEGDITVHVGRRKTKVDFELRAHMEKRKSSADGSNYLETSELESGEEEVTFNNQ
ncbi:FGR15 Filamentous growth regulator 15 [Candida maltosa Xu316]